MARRSSSTSRSLRLSLAKTVALWRATAAWPATAFARRSQLHGPVAVISDLYDRRGFREAFDVLLHRGYQPRLFHVYAPCEAEPKLLGDVELADIEAGTLQTATITEWAAARYRQRFAEFCRSVRDYCRRRVIPLVQVASNATEDEVLKRVLQHTRNSRRLTAAGMCVANTNCSGGC